MIKIIKSRGFTLVELLAVIVVLAIILMIAVPRVLSVIEESDKEAFRITGEQLIKGAIDRQVIETIGPLEEKTYTITNGEFVGDSIPMIGELPDNGTIHINSDGNVLIAIKNNKFCGIKKYEDTTINIVDDLLCELPESKTYGVTFNNATVGTRTDDAIGLTYTVNASTINSAFDTEEIYKDITEVTDSYGNVFVSIPRFYIKKTKSSGNIWTYQISKDKQDINYYLPECFKDSSTGTLLDNVLIGKYNASLEGTQLESKSGKNPLVNQNINTFRTYARNNGEKYQLIDIHAIDMLQVLFIVEFASLDNRSIMKGYIDVYPTPALTGTTNSIVSKSGSPLSNINGQNTMKYRGIENFYGNIWQFVDGINIMDLRAFVSKNPDNYASNVFSNDYKNVGYLNSNNREEWLEVNTFYGLPTEMGYDKDYPYVNLPTIASLLPAESIYRSLYFSRIGSRVALFGGSWVMDYINNHTAYNFDDYWVYEYSPAGLFTWFFNLDENTTEDVAGSRLMKKM